MNQLLVVASILIFVIIAQSGSSDRLKESNEESEKANQLHKKALNLLKTSSKHTKKAYELLQKAAQLNHIGSKELVAKAHLFGDPLPLDLTKAFQYFESIPTNQSSDAHLFRGFLYSNDLNDLVSGSPLFKADESLAITHYQMAATLGNNLAKMAIAFRYLYGLGTDKSCKKALHLYRSVAVDVVEVSKSSGGGPLVDYRLWESKSSLDFMNHVIHYYKFLAKGGDITAMVTLGNLFFYGGFRVERDLKRAFSYFIRASKSGDGNALAFLAKYYSEGIPPVTKNQTKALELLLISSAKDNPIAMTELGLMYLEGRELGQDSAKAHRFLTSASRLGWVDGIVHSGIAFLTNSTGFKDHRRAFNSFQLAEKSRHLLALYNLGLMHASGVGTVRSCPRAVSYFKSVAERGVWSEGLLQGIDKYEKGFKREAIVRLALMSELGYELAQSNIAFILEKNIDYKNRAEIALKYWMRSATQGTAYSRIKAGDYFYYGLGTAVDYQRSVFYYRKASEFRYSAQALFNLGYMHEKGLGVKRDTKVAKLYYQMAATVDPNAKAPAFLANIKLNCFETVDQLMGRVLKFKLLLPKNWDLILISFLAVILCYALYLRLSE